jgi:hypothetical protein
VDHFKTSMVIVDHFNVFKLCGCKVVIENWVEFRYSFSLEELYETLLFETAPSK